MKIQDIDPSAFLVDGGQWTAREIAHQPAVWAEAIAQAERSDVAGWLAQLLSDPLTRVVFTGAGTSAYIGDSLVPALLAHAPQWVGSTWGATKSGQLGTLFTAIGAILFIGFAVAARSKDVRNVEDTPI